MEHVIETLSKNLVIHCKKCDFQGEVTVTRKYYINCPECNKTVYVGHLT